MLLELLEVIYNKGRYIESRVIIIYIDNKYVYKIILGEIQKPSLYAADVGVEIMRMREILEDSSFEIIITLITKLKIKALFRDNPGPHLILKCNKEARIIQETIKSQSNIINIKFYGKYVIAKDREILIRLIKEIVCVNDASNSEYK